jgi:hypothetical protein
MENICLNAQVNKFFHAVGPNFDVFKRKMEQRAKKNNIHFDEDVFMDTVLRCMNTFPTENATTIDIDNYFWRAFKQNSFSNFSRNKFRDTINLDEFGDDIIDEEYNADIDEIVDLIKAEVKNEFGHQIYDAWLLHVCNDYTYTELEKNGYKGLNLHNEFRQIKRHICNKFVKNNNKLKTLLIENNFM